MMRDYRCWAEIDLDAIRENLAWLRDRMGAERKLMTVVKADAYGHGLRQIAAHLMQNGTDVFGVANLEEALTIHRIGPGWPVLMLGACLPGEMDEAVREEVMLTISNGEEAERLSRVAAKQGKSAIVHLKVDTGMGRLGVASGEAVDLARRLPSMPGIRLEGLMTHFAAAEEDAAFTDWQRNLFERVVKDLRDQGLRPPLVHAFNSAAILHEEDEGFYYNMVRPGLLVYGIWPKGARSIGTDLAVRLKQVLTWKCRVGLVKEVTKGVPLSYGGSFVTPRPMRIATLTVGYGDGYLRAAGNRAKILVGGVECPVVGRVTMDQTLVDIGTAGEVKAGDEAVLIGRQGRAAITANRLAEWCNTIPWEIVTNISYRVPRVYRGGKAA